MGAPLPCRRNCFSMEPTKRVAYVATCVMLAAKLSDQQGMLVMSPALSTAKFPNDRKASQHFSNSRCARAFYPRPAQPFMRSILQNPNPDASFFRRKG